MTDVRLDEETDAGEFILQNVFNLSVPQTTKEALSAVLCGPREECTPEALATAVRDNADSTDDSQSGRVVLYSLNSHIEEYGMEFDGMRRRREMTAREYSLADQGVASAMRFVSAAAQLVL